MLLCSCQSSEGPIHFQTFHLPSSPNYFLACPKDYCAAESQQVVPIYPVSVTQLQQAWDRAIAPEPRFSLVLDLPDQHQRVYVQKSAFFRFPDFIHVQFIEISEQASTLAVYSHSKYGYSDFNVNQKRVLRLLERLGRNLTPE